MQSAAEQTANQNSKHQKKYPKKKSKNLDSQMANYRAPCRTSPPAGRNFRRNSESNENTANSLNQMGKPAAAPPETGLNLGSAAKTVEG